MSTATRRVLFVGWDGAEWSIIRPLVNAGLLPNITRLIEGGVSGNLASPAPQRSIPAWTSIVTGKRAWKHGVVGPGEVRPNGLDVRPATAYSRRVSAIWNCLSQRGIRSCVVNAWSEPPEPIDGHFVCNPAFESNLPFVHPAELESELRSLVLTPADVEDDLLKFMLPQIDSLATRVNFQVDLCKVVLAHTASVHAIACRLLRDPWQFGAVFYSGLETLSHAFLRFHPPKLPDVDDAEFQFFRHVVSSIYRMHDSLLGRLLELAGDDAHAMLVSDHGFVNGAARAGRMDVHSDDDAVAQHRAQGVLILRGPGIIADDTVEGASVLDVTPTLLKLFDLPVGSDMDGRPVENVFESPEPSKFIPSWDTAESSGRLPPESPSPVDEEIRYLVDLGYTERPTFIAQQRIAATRARNAFNFAISLIEGGRINDAIALLRPLVNQHPENPNYGKTLFEAYMAGGRTVEAREVVQRAWNRGFQGSMQHIGFALLEYAEHHNARALEHLNAASALDADQPDLNAYLGQVYLRLQRWEQADAAFSKELEQRPDHETAWTGRAAIALQQRLFEEAAECALKAVGLRADLAEAHLMLGLSLYHLKNSKNR